MGQKRSGYPSDVSDEEWALGAPYLVLLREDAAQRVYPLRAVFNAVRYLAKSGCGWRMLPNDLPPWPAVHQQLQRWIAAERFEMMAHDLREVLRVAAGREAQPTAAILDSRTIQSTPSSGARAGYDGAKRRKGSKVHAAVDTLGHVLALRVTSASDQDRAQVGVLAADVQAATGENVTLAYVDQGYTGPAAADAASTHGIDLEVIKLDHAKRGFVLLPRRWVVERSFGWAARFRRLARDYERLPASLAGLHWLAFACLMLSSLLKQSA